MEDKRGVCDEPVEHLLQEHEHEFAEELSDGGERNEIAEEQQAEPLRRKRIRTG
ncbi:hypothetical protein N0O92_12545 [Alkalihalobacillus sp. MEB130]|uniref:hypothetical protein n=1 Tax=Alkalihalobacillus sp. MEB130 TaxID=2976704 RepID=UPI0028DE0E61|nr:hypothetical protein [Alkalihalobacillus sp. MEB130]MDT8861064.1 hypothetical protein [Alkalihalobacillus sp. MEB130]